MDSIRVQLAGIESEELGLLKIRSTGPAEARARTEVILIGLLILSLISSGLIAFYTSRSITSPIQTLMRSTEIIGQGNLDHKIGITARDEVGQLSQSFEKMLGNLRATMASKSVLEEEIAIRKTTEMALLETKQYLEDSELQLIESNKTKDKFLSIIAHDLRSPFNSLLGFSRLLDENFDNLSVEKKKDFVDIIKTGLEDTFLLLENLLVWSRTQGGYIDFIPQQENLYFLSKKAADVTQLTAKIKSISIKIQIPRDILVETDPYMLDTIIRNLLTNAVKFTPENGNILITANLQTGEAGSGQAEIRVKDNGVGISVDRQQKLFDIGETVSTKGTANEPGAGLGLNICHDFVRMHGGKIWVESAPGEGSTFCFTLPNASQSA